MAGLTAVVVTLAACEAKPIAVSVPSTTSPSVSTASSTPAPSVSTATATIAAAPTTSSAAPRTSPAVPAKSSPATHTNAAPGPVTSTNAPVIVIDPGHSVPVHGIDRQSGLDVSDYENEPEMRNVFAVAQLVRAELVAAGYRVVLTKSSVDTPATLGQRAQIANAAHAALALSIHDQAGANGGIGFDQGNNIVYSQSVGSYRTTPTGKRIYFTDQAIAALSKRYGAIFKEKRASAQGRPITLLGNTGYDLGSRGLPAGDIWIVQLLSKVPWIYNEAGGNSAGMVGLSRADEQRYANGLVAAVEACVPIRN
jgi:N-acetylmuramoyl-L-alanine amidase